MNIKLGLAGLAVVAVGAAIYLSLPGGAPSGRGVVAPAVLSPTAESGARLFAAKCAVCHGENASGTDQGPPLVHKIYEPGHHGDASFLAAVRNGVRQHHWSFGDMPRVDGVSERAARRITVYVRELQQANGIF